MYNAKCKPKKNFEGPANCQYIYDIVNMFTISGVIYSKAALTPKSKECKNHFDGLAEEVGSWKPLTPIVSWRHDCYQQADSLLSVYHAPCANTNPFANTNMPGEALVLFILQNSF